MKRPTTWRVQYFREGSPHPVSHYYYGTNAETRARAKADNLRQTEEARGVTVDRIERPDATERPVFLEPKHSLRASASVFLPTPISQEGAPK